MEIRKIVTHIEETFIEGFKQAEKPVKIAAVGAVIKNPYAGKYVQDLNPLIEECSEYLGELLPRIALEKLGINGELVESYGKGALVGLDGEVEHGSAIIHTMTFGNPFRKLCDNAKTLLPAAEKRGAAGSSIDLAMKHKMDPKIRSHHMTFEFRIPDAPRNDEIVVIAAISDGGRVHPRIGSLHEQLKQLGDTESK
ncbi:amino acid synthesis family protein [Lysinibacillus capsici]